MAGQNLVVNEILSYTLHKFGKLNRKFLKQVISGFYKTDEIIFAKELILKELESICSLNSLPRFATVRDSLGNGVVENEVENILEIISCIKDKGCLEDIPKYVVLDLGNIPPSHMEEGHFRFLCNKMDDFSVSLNKFDIGGFINQVAKTPAAITETLAFSQVNKLRHSAINRSDMLARPGDQVEVHSEIENTTNLLQSTSRDNVDQMLINNESDEFKTVESRKRQRQRNPSDSPELNSKRTFNVNSSQDVYRNSVLKPKGTKTFIGRSTESSLELKASKSFKSFFYIGNVAKGVRKEAVEQFILDKLGFNCVSCFPINSRSNSGESETEDEMNIPLSQLARHNKTEQKSNAFRVCVKTFDVKKFTNVNLWPEHVILRKWVFNEKKTLS